MASPDSDAQSTVFWERLQRLFARDEEELREGDKPQRRGLAVFICLLTSCILWFAFALQEVQTTEIEVPTRVINLGPDEALAALPPDQVRVQVRGEGIQMLQLALDPPVVPINASAEQVNLRSAVNLPDELMLVSVFPQYLALDKEERIARRVPVRLRATIETPATHDVMEPPEIDPDSVMVSGARSVIEALAYWPTDSVAISGVTDRIVRRVPLADTLGGLVERSVEAVQLAANVQQFTEAVREIEVRVPGSPERAVTLEPPAVRVQYRVPVAQYQEAQEAPGFFATVSYDQIRTDTTGRVTPQVHVPSDLAIRDVEVNPPFLRYYNFIPGQDVEGRPSARSRLDQ